MTEPPPKKKLRERRKEGRKEGRKERASERGDPGRVGMEGRRAVAGGRIERGGTLARRRRDARRSTTAIDARWRCGRSERRKKRRTRPRRAHLSKKLAAKSLMSSADSNISSTPSSPSSRVRHSYALTTSLNFFSDSASPGFLSGWCFSASFLRWIRVGRRRAGEGVRFEAAGAVVVVVVVSNRKMARVSRAGERRPRRTRRAPVRLPHGVRV